MPCLDISTNVNLDGIELDSILSEITKAVSQITGKPENFVMIILKGSVALSFGGSKEGAALAEIVSMDNIDSKMKKELIATIGTILQNNLSIPRTRFVLKVFDISLMKKISKL